VGGATGVAQPLYAARAARGIGVDAALELDADRGIALAARGNAQRTAEKGRCRRRYADIVLGELEPAVDLLQGRESGFRLQPVVDELVIAADPASFQRLQRQLQLQAKPALTLGPHALGKPVDHRADRALSDEIQEIGGRPFRLATDDQLLVVV